MESSGDKGKLIEGAYVTRRLSDADTAFNLLTGHRCLVRHLYLGYQAYGQRCLFRHPFQSCRLSQPDKTPNAFCTDS